MSDEQVKTVDKSQDEEYSCVVCFKNIEIYSIGACDHPFCHECSTRMRVLCVQNECPICRQSLSKVIFTNDNKPYRELERQHRSPYYNKQYKIAFMTNKIQQAYFDLLANICPKCDHNPFSNFDHLRDHVRREHEHFYCDLCVSNLKIFTFERRCYNRQQLAVHRRVGDADNTSHRGHPLCEYCDVRYLDRDELFRHLRREHFYCHFCDADGTNQFYSDYKALHTHFKESHFVCDQCTENFAGIFRSDIDLKAHLAHTHAKSMGKLQEKQTRTLQLEITLGPRHSRQTDTGVAHVRSRVEEPINSIDDYEIPPDQPVRQQSINAQDEQQFPSLLSSNAANANLAFQPLDIRNKFGLTGLARTKENFPALGGGGSVGLPNSGSKNSKAVPSVSNILKKTPNPSNSSVMIHVSNRPKGEKVPSKKDFPSLPSSSRQAPPAYISNVAAKHRNLVDDYVSAASGAFQKLNLVQQEEVKPDPKFTTPSLTKQDFPTLAKVTKSSPDLPIVKTSNGKKTTNTSSWANTTQLRKSLSKTNAKYGLDNNNKKDVTNKMNGNAKPKENKKEKPKTNGPKPPGFDGPKPPPGFSSVSLNSIAKTANNLTFTSSLGDKFRIVPSFQFTPPENCGKRNQDLVKIFKSSMPTAEAMEEFRNNTQRFRNGSFNARAYYEHCEFVLEDKFHVVFPELLALLPDIGKQQELYLVYSQRLKHLQKKGITNKLKVCSVCKQVLLTTDHIVHMAIHENNNKAE